VRLFARRRCKSAFVRLNLKLARACVAPSSVRMAVHKQSVVGLRRAYRFIYSFVALQASPRFAKRRRCGRCARTVASLCRCGSERNSNVLT